jgi:hypothetical protein
MYPAGILSLPLYPVGLLLFPSALTLLGLLSLTVFWSL